MVDQNLITELDTAGTGLDEEIQALFAEGDTDEQITQLIDRESEECRERDSRLA